MNPFTHKTTKPMAILNSCSRIPDNIKIDLWEIGFGDVDWIHLAQDRDTWRALVNTVMNLWDP
jgi:hypothetical protein